MKRLSRDQFAARVARDIPEGACVDLGIGLPTQVANHLPRGREIVLHSENGLLGMGSAPAAGDEDAGLINAGKQPVTCGRAAGTRIRLTTILEESHGTSVYL